MRTIPVGQIVRTTGVLEQNGLEPALCERFARAVSFAQRRGAIVRTIFTLVFVRKTKAVRYANDFRLGQRLGAERRTLGKGVEKA